MNTVTVTLTHAELITIASALGRYADWLDPGDHLGPHTDELAAGAAATRGLRERILDA